MAKADRVKGTPTATGGLATDILSGLEEVRAWAAGEPSEVRVTKARRPKPAKPAATPGRVVRTTITRDGQKVVVTYTAPPGEMADARLLARIRKAVQASLAGPATGPRATSSPSPRTP